MACVFAASSSYSRRTIISCHPRFSLPDSHTKLSCHMRRWAVLDLDTKFDSKKTCNSMCKLYLDTKMRSHTNLCVCGDMCRRKILWWIWFRVIGDRGISLEDIQKNNNHNPQGRRLNLPPSLSKIMWSKRPASVQGSRVKPQTRREIFAFDTKKNFAYRFEKWSLR